MVHSPILKIAAVLILLAAGIVIIFFSHQKDQSPELYITRQEEIIKNTANVEERFLKEFNLAEYFVQQGQLIQAAKHFKNVYEGYPEMPKGYIKLKALQYMLDIQKVLEEKKSAKKLGKKKNIPDRIIGATRKK